MSSKKSRKQSDIINLFLGLLIVVIVNVLSQYAFTRADLTAEKKYTLTESTKDMLDSLEDIVYFKVYLEGEFPQGAGDFKRLRDETRIMLDEFRVFGDNIQYEFIDPNEDADASRRKEFHDQLEDKGLIKQKITFTDDNGTDAQVDIFPWAIATFHGKETAVPLMGSNNLKPTEVQLNNAVEGLEYELSNAIRKLLMRTKPSIAVTMGHGEHDTLQIGDLVKTLREYYTVEYVNFNGNLNAFRDTLQKANQIAPKYDAIIVASPDSAFTPNELFIIDQYIMYGGKALFLVDPVNTNMDSLAMRGYTIGLPHPIGIEELTFRYGARLNNTLVEDLNCANLALPAPGQPNQFIAAPWYFSPTILPREEHPIVKNLDRIKFDFLSTVDTVGTTANIKKTVLLRSSDKSRFLRTPTRIALQMAMIERDPRSFNKPDQSVAVLLEGRFDSYYKNKFLPDTIKNSPLIGFKDSGRDSKIIVVGDGDVAANLVYKGKSLPLGMDRINRMNRELYSNKTFLLNCMNYLLDDKGLLSVRSRDVTLRLLERTKIKEHRLKWQLINTIGPIAYVVFFGMLMFWLRRRTYAIGKPVASTITITIWILVLAPILILSYALAQHTGQWLLNVAIWAAIGVFIAFADSIFRRFSGLFRKK